MKMLKNINGIDYVIIHNDILIHCYPQTRDIKHFSIENPELSGKSYEIIVGGCVIYNSYIKTGKNLFPIDIFPLSRVYYHQVFIFIKNIDVPNIDLHVTYILTKNICNKNIDDVCEYIYPFQDCITCKEKTKELHKFGNNNILSTRLGMCGLKYSNTCSDYEVISTTNERIMPHDLVYPVSIVTIKNKTEDLSVYYRNHQLIQTLIDLDVDIITENIKYPCANINENTFEHLAMSSDIIYNIEFNCENNDINLVVLLATNKNPMDLSTRDIHIPIEKTTNGYRVKTPNMALCSVSYFLIIKIYTTNNNPIEIQYNNAVLNKNARRAVVDNGGYYINL